VANLVVSVSHRALRRNGRACRLPDSHAAAYSPVECSLEERLAERTRIAQELHDTLLQGVYGASIHFDLANHRLPQDSPARSAMQRGLELLRQVSQDGRKALRSLRSSQPA
jgi:signal transduction histidine kinase